MGDRRKSTIFRVTGLARDQSDMELEAALKEALTANFSNEERYSIQTEIAIVLSCYHFDQERMALVQFDSNAPQTLSKQVVPQFLSELEVNPLQDWQIQMGDTDINIDCHFHGFTQLYTPPNDEPVTADIIAITGLDGHAYGSWRGKGNLRRMWLRNFFSKDFPRCRTMIYGSNLKLSSRGTHDLLDYGREMLEGIKKIRNTKEKLLKQMSKESDVLVQLRTDLINLIEDRKVNDKLKRWERMGDFFEQVPSVSALLDLNDHRETKLPVDADHSTIVKFDHKQNPTYQSVSNKLREFEKHAHNCVANRFSQQPNRPKTPSTVPFARDVRFVGREDTIGEINKRMNDIGRQHNRIALQGLAGVGREIPDSN
ncbi:hypothetical protein N7463_008615 [Penicillium fimorum]|uniref:Uncharacterized protein n=1 Tax=Penicillium fimorum TaxID=1882269 RepID=A0A9X0C3G3_9EURO|nr:hypothetical protein N7463_008615 [Penicillium fimorum]